MDEPEAQASNSPHGSRFPLESLDLHDASTRDELVAMVVDARKARLLGRFAAGVGHDLNNSLTAVAAFAQLARSNPDLPEDVRDDAELATREVERTRALLNAFTSFALARSPERQETAPSALVGSVRELVAHELQRSGAALDLDIPSGLPDFAIDRAEVQLAVLALVTDAIDAVAASGVPGSISIRGDARDDRVAIAVSTSAPRLTSNPLEVAALCAIAGAHGGRLIAEPDGVVIELPAVAGRPATSPPAVPPATRGGIVLVVDDEPVMRQFLARALTINGREARLAASGRDAIEAAADRAVGLVICDQNLADLSGIEVYQAIAAGSPEMAQRFVLMSGDPDSRAITRFATAEGIPVLAKPFGLDAVRRLLERYPPDG